MRVLIVAATEAEIEPLMKKRDEAVHHNPEILITGVGMVATTYHLAMKLASSSYDLVINAGIAGSFDRSLALGEVVQVVSEQFSEAGAEDGDNFLSLIKIGLMQPDEFPFAWGELIPAAQDMPTLQGLKQVRGITVNTVHGNIQSIMEVRNRLNPQVESMEGAAVFYCCMMQRIPCIQLRAVSNYVERRNRASWKIQEAITNLNNKTSQLISSL